MITRPPLKHRQIVSDLRTEIVKGIFAPGSQLPTRESLESRFAASRVTIQRALDELTRDGFVHARGRLGTFVSAHPPHLSRIGLVFHHRPKQDGSWSRFWTAIRNEAALIEQHALPRITPYYGPESPGDESFQSLIKDVKSQCIAGLLFTSMPLYLKGSVPLEQPGVPRVAIMTRQELGIPAVDVDSFSFVDKALDYLRARKRKRIAVMLGFQSLAYREQLIRGISLRGMRTEPYWIQSASPDFPKSATNCLHLLMNKHQTVRPDGIIVADDNLVEHAAAGLVAAGVQVPTDADVIVHCNFPWPTPSVLPVKRLGYNVRELIRTCLRILDMQRDGKRVPPHTMIPAMFEDELSGAQL